MTGRSGYSVFEVLIAFIIMAMVLAVLIPGQARMLLRASETDATVLAQDLAISRMAHFGVSRPVEIGEATSVHGDWQVVENVVPEGDNLAIIEVTVLSDRGKVLASITTTRRIP